MISISGAMPVANRRNFRIHKDKMILRVPESESKEREYFLISHVRRERTPAEKHNVSAQASVR